MNKPTNTSAPPPVRLRPAVGTAIGTTAFFRNRPLYAVLLQELQADGKPAMDVLFHACSVGAEVYSLVISYLAAGLDRIFELRCHATDKQQEFVEFARQAQYPRVALDGMSPDEARWFDTEGEIIRPVHDVRDRVSFLPATDLAAFTSKRQYDVVSVQNVLVYVSSQDQATIIDQVAAYNSGWLLLTGFHRDTIKADLQRNAYTPVLTDIEAIHNSWTDRLTPAPIPAESLPAHIYTDWSLQPFEAVEDYEYRHCALFTRRHG